MKRLGWLFVFLLCCASIVSAKTIVAVSDPFPPFVDPSNPSGGLAIEVIRAAYKTQGHEVKVEYVPWARAEAGVASGIYDILPNMWFSEARSKNFLFSTAYVNNTIRFVKRKGDPFVFQGIESLKGKTVGVTRGYTYSDAFKNSTLFRREDANGLLINLKKLQAKRIDLTLDDEAVVNDTISRNNPKLLSEIEMAEGHLSVNPLYVVSGIKNPNHKEWIESFNAGLKVIKENGVLADIFKKYGLPYK
ncbi:transporter substrate-binding domain-containing protein [Deefgea tanakiae]|jgi:polar amino acid transport system substrate-binding protein|uniref:Transporter substrate-binding domain-containing protein n=1 Tax=Deefgea tanakiae TaxID=2865840 RepID=A0ABX8Z7F8_9NEIS|nr:transporter substrate-binding domain-containing protein [Deefgea tanakiae]QZA78526.1 transporter substrate-binding domain-containing protein [Deefgea tanakiae]